MNLEFSNRHFDTLIGGKSVLDVLRLDIQDLSAAQDFLNAYGFDLNKEEDQRRLWTYHREAIEFLRNELLLPDENIPEILCDPQQLKEIAYLLIYASSPENHGDSLGRWACAILKVIHVFVHLHNDIFTRFSTEIQNQILRPFQNFVTHDPDLGITLQADGDPERIPLKAFDIKPFKSINSSVIKLLAKPDAVAFSLLDKIGVRFVTKHLVDVFRLMRFMLDHHLVSFPHVIPDQSNNTLFPVNLFLEVIAEIERGQNLSSHEIDQLMKARLELARDRAVYREKLNIFSGKEYHFVKFIARRLVQVEWEGQKLSFFYPFEIQIVDDETHQRNSQGPASHSEYKRRQVAQARSRVLGAMS